MFRRASVHGANEDEVIDIRERLAPYGAETELSLDWQERFVVPDTRQARHLRTDDPLAPLHLVR
jgi:hypothetical protein